MDSKGLRPEREDSLQWDTADLKEEIYITKPVGFISEDHPD